MSQSTKEKLLHALRERRDEIVDRWLKSQNEFLTRPDIAFDERQLRRQCKDFIDMVHRAVSSGAPMDDTSDDTWSEVRAMLAELSKLRVHGGFDWRENASFLLSLKRPLLQVLTGDEEMSRALFEEVWRVSSLLDQLGLFTAQVYVDTRESVIEQQREDLIELSSPVVQLWEDILVLPIIGTLDSRRAQEVMTALLEQIERTGSQVVILDITGVSAVDTLVAQHLLKTVAAARLMGAECIMSGVGPQIAQTIVHLGIDFGSLVTRSSLADALLFAFSLVGKRVINDSAGA